MVMKKPKRDPFDVASIWMLYVAFAMMAVLVAVNVSPELKFYILSIIHY